MHYDVRLASVGNRIQVRLDICGIPQNPTAPGGDYRLSEMCAHYYYSRDVCGKLSSHANPTGQAPRGQWGFYSPAAQSIMPFTSFFCFARLAVSSVLASPTLVSVSARMAASWFFARATCGHRVLS